MKKYLFLVAAIVYSLTIFASTPEGYYSSIEGTSGDNILAALYSKINSHTDVGYDGLYEVYKTADVTADGYVWDMYSTCKYEHDKRKCGGSYKNVCDCYNREHSVPQSWFSGQHMKSDAFHVYPTDGKVNGQRSNYPFGECSGGKNLGGAALGRLGSSTFSGYSGTVFEPDDEFKGDFARSYFYMVACYRKSSMNAAQGDVVFTYSGGVSGLTSYAVNLFMKWHRQDPVSEKELKRNDAVYAIQKNRNPFIDYPELAEYIWGDKKGTAVSLSDLENAYDGSDNTTPSLTSPAEGYIINIDNTLVGDVATASFVVKGKNLTSDLSLTIEGDDADLFTVSPSSVTAQQTVAGQTVALIFKPNEVGKFAVQLAIKSDKVERTIKVYASCVEDDEPACCDPLEPTVEMPLGDYQKVDSELDDWTGWYLLVSDNDSVALNLIDEQQTPLAVEILGNTIAETAERNAAAIIIEQQSEGLTLTTTELEYLNASSVRSETDILLSHEPQIHSINFADSQAMLANHGKSLSYDAGKFQYRRKGTISLYRKEAEKVDALQMIGVDAQIEVVGQTLNISAQQTVNISVYNAMGILVFAGSESQMSIQMPAVGLYIISINNHLQKVVVR